MLYNLKRTIPVKGKLKALILWLCCLLLLAISPIKAQNEPNQVQNKYSYSQPIPVFDTLDNAEHLMKEAIVHYDAGRYQSCLSRLDKAISVNKFEQLKDILFFYRAVCKAKINDYSAAIEDYNHAIVQNPDKIKYYYHRGLAYFKNGQYKDAQTDFENTMQSQGEDADLLLKIGFLKEQSNQLQGAIDDYSKALTHNSKLAEAYFLRGQLYLRVLLPEKGCKDLQSAMQLHHIEAKNTFDKYCKNSNF